jgi:small conductance mechanosensitive channel
MEEEIKTAQRLMDFVIQFVVNYSFQILGAILVLIIGYWVAKWAGRMLLRLMEKKHMDVTLSKFIVGIAKLVIFAFAFIVAMGKFGITISPFIAALGAIGFGGALAFQGVLSNLVAGFTIILTRPFVVGNTIAVAGVSGLVQEVKLSATTLVDEDGVKITVPNRHIVGQVLHNSAENKIVEGSVGIGYDSEFEKAMQTIRQILEGFAQVVKEPAPQIGIQKFGDSAVEVAYRYWVPTLRYFQAAYAVNLAVFKALQEAGIEIPFPRREIRIVSSSSEGKAE